VYLNAAALGDVPIIRQSLEETNDVSLNVNCVDYMGRSALHLAVDSESMEAVELLLDRINYECIEESLLHAISKGATKIVKVWTATAMPSRCYSTQYRYVKNIGHFERWASYQRCCKY